MFPGVLRAFKPASDAFTSPGATLASRRNRRPDHLPDPRPSSGCRSERRSRRLRSLWRPEPSKVRYGHTEQKCRAACSTTKSQTGDRVFNFILKARGRPCAAKNEAQIGTIASPRITQDASSHLMVLAQSFGSAVSRGAVMTETLHYDVALVADHGLT